MDYKYATRYRPEIDGLRGLAVLVVVINHFNKNILSSGYLGVDIFFVISGFVITSSFSSIGHKRFWPFITEFFFKRIKRLYPVLLIFLLIASIILCFFHPYPSGEVDN